MAGRLAVLALVAALLAGCGEKPEPAASRVTAVTGTVDLARAAGRRAPATASTTRSSLAFAGRVAPPSSQVLLRPARGAAVAVAGQAGVKEVLDNLRAELDLTMALAGCASRAEIGPDALSGPH